MHARKIGFGFRQCLVPERCRLRGFVPRLSHQPSQTQVRGGTSWNSGTGREGTPTSWFGSSVRFQTQ